MHWRAKHTFLMQPAHEFSGMRLLLLLMVREVVISGAPDGKEMLLLGVFVLNNDERNLCVSCSLAFLMLLLLGRVLYSVTNLLPCFPRNDAGNNEALYFTSRSSDCLPVCRLLSAVHRSALCPSVYFCSPFPPSFPPRSLKSPFTHHIHPLALSMWAKEENNWHTSQHKDMYVCLRICVLILINLSCFFPPGLQEAIMNPLFSHFHLPAAPSLPQKLGTSGEAAEKRCTMKACLEAVGRCAGSRPTLLSSRM